MPSWLSGFAGTAALPFTSDNRVVTEADEDDFETRLEATLVGGLEPRVVEIVAYKDEWPRRFERERRRLSDALEGVVRRIEHIGSTSVPGLASKDVVDICVTVEDADDEDAYLPLVEGLYYVLHAREPGHRCFRTAARDVNLHVYADDAEEVHDYLVLRERLRSSAEDRRLYEQVKRELAAKGEWPDVNYYADAKTDVIQDILGRAEALDDGGSRR